MADKGGTKFNIANIVRIVLIIAGVLIIGVSVFFFFKVRTESKAALREAKNIRMALRMADIEFYAQEKSVFNPNNYDGLEEGAKAKVEQIVQPEGTYRITSYSTKYHEITGMTYRVGNYNVIFSKEGENISWDVTYLMRIYHFDEEDTKIVKK